MRKIIFQMMTTVDGYYEGPNGEIDWHNVDDEFNDYAIGFLNSLDGLLFGKKTYELMAGYWPTDNAVNDDALVANKMNSISKYVISKTLKNAEWNNTKVISNNVEEEIGKLKLQPGGDIAIFGSSDLVVSLIQSGLIDEYRIFINPTALGNGKPLFAGLTGKVRFELISTRVFKSGNVLLSYKQADK